MTGMFRPAVAAIALASQLSACVTDDGSTQVSRIQAHDDVSRIFASACMDNMRKLSRSKTVLQNAGFDISDQSGGVTVYANTKTGVVALAGDFSITAASGGVTLDKVKAYHCFVGGPLLSVPRANAIVETMRAKYLAGKGNYTVGKPGGYTTITAAKDVIGMPFEVAATTTFVKFDKPQSAQITPSTHLDMAGLPLVGVGITVTEN